jgi:hypothetical protein
MKTIVKPLACLLTSYLYMSPACGQADAPREKARIADGQLGDAKSAPEEWGTLAFESTRDIPEFAKNSNFVAVGSFSSNCLTKVTELLKTAKISAFINYSHGVISLHVAPGQKVQAVKLLSGLSKKMDGIKIWNLSSGNK